MFVGIVTYASFFFRSPTSSQRPRVFLRREQMALAPTIQGGIVEVEAAAGEDKHRFHTPQRSARTQQRRPVHRLRERLSFEILSLSPFE